MSVNTKSRTLSFAVLIATVLVVSGCATMNEEECRAADWYSIGFEDGANGRPVGYISGHREACAEYGISPDAERYQQGWGEGIRRYCTAQNGYQAGLRGSSVRAQCPADQNSAFLAAYQYGHRINIAERELSAINRDAAAKQRELQQIQQELAHIERQLVSGGMSDAQQDRLLAQLRQLYRREVELEAQLAKLDEAEGKPKPEPKPNNGKPDKNKDKEKEKENTNKGDPGRVDSSNKGNNKVAQNKDAKRNDQQRKAMEKELAVVRQQIHTLESRLERDNREQQRWKLLQRSKQLSKQAGVLHAELQLLERRRLEMEAHIHLLRQRSPY